MAEHHLAQINVGHALFPLDDRRMHGFMSQLDRINALADRAPGFVWRLQTEAGNATDVKLTEDPAFIVNMSVWTDIDALFDYVYKSDHREVMALRRHWFRRPAGPYQALWWVPGRCTSDAAGRPAAGSTLGRARAVAIRIHVQAGVPA